MDNSFDNISQDNSNYTSELLINQEIQPAKFINSSDISDITKGINSIIEQIQKPKSRRSYQYFELEKLELNKFN